nr:uncharacterized protein CI109_003200 [Kwoniella shandongensis]KAA5528302.1 hypothetical protein CI109_003200 [Kwoniella shandongensis]
MGCLTSRYHKHPEFADLPFHEIDTEQQGRRFLGAKRGQPSIRQPMAQRDSVAEARTIISAMGGWHESAIHL